MPLNTHVAALKVYRASEFHSVAVMPPATQANEPSANPAATTPRRRNTHRHHASYENIVSAHVPAVIAPISSHADVITAGDPHARHDPSIRVAVIWTKKRNAQPCAARNA